MQWCLLLFPLSGTFLLQMTNAAFRCLSLPIHMGKAGRYIWYHNEISEITFFQKIGSTSSTPPDGGLSIVARMATSHRADMREMPNAAPKELSLVRTRLV